MICPSCKFHASSVIDSRPRSTTIWRRRECNACHHRWTTNEYLEQPGIDVARDMLKKLKSDMHDLIDNLTI